MDLRTLYRFEDLTNDAERLVIEELGEQLEANGEYSVINDEGLVLDIAAYALNHVPPMYRVNLLGRLYATTLREKYGEEIKTAVTQAIEKIIGSG